ncbi:MAG: helix-turn-helix transcriptional regulator [Muribaculum sp.]|nr:helix-turn-helix transcriptional regulator [Muribaculum sp.]
MFFKKSSKCFQSAFQKYVHSYNIQLKEMVEDGLIAKTIYPELPPRLDHIITELGKSLIPIIDSMLAWDNEHMQLFEKKYGKP